ncbi:DUF4870 domain-containing protein [Pseudogracilibacillus sp. ICA-222130]|uniref:DUF4870 domain-containing protein n=1 Tax=Pseudogracilibacillus sp. ICA-222130 TaxID=3134655 RepID=UPI0030C2025C
MTENKVLSSLSYFSLFFAPVLFPIIVYFLTNGETRRHARNAFASHIIPSVLLIGGGITIGLFGINGWTHAPISLALLFIVFAILSFVLLIYNIVLGIKVLIEE